MGHNEDQTHQVSYHSEEDSEKTRKHNLGHWGREKKKKITLLHKQPIKSLERCHSIELLDQQMGRTVMDGLERSDNSNFLERRRHLSHKNIHQKSLKAQCSHTNPCST